MWWIISPASAASSASLADIDAGNPCVALLRLPGWFRGPALLPVVTPGLLCFLSWPLRGLLWPPYALASPTLLPGTHGLLWPPRGLTLLTLLPVLALA